MPNISTTSFLTAFIWCILMHLFLFIEKQILILFALIKYSLMYFVVLKCCAVWAYLSLHSINAPKQSAVSYPVLFLLLKFVWFCSLYGIRITWFDPICMSWPIPLTVVKTTDLLLFYNSILFIFYLLRGKLLTFILTRTLAM